MTTNPEEKPLRQMGGAYVVLGAIAPKHMLTGGWEGKNGPAVGASGTKVPVHNSLIINALQLIMRLQLKGWID